MRFTPRQLECIEFSARLEGRPLHLVIEAGAGAGKTAVLAERVVWTICDAPPHERLAPHEITLATFTRAAEKELRERVASKLAERKPGAAEALHISTIDSLLMSLFDSLFAGFWFEAFGHDAGRSPPAVSLVDEAEVSAELDRDIPRFLEGLVSKRNGTEQAAIYDFILAGAFRSPESGSLARGSDPRQELSRFMLSEACLLLSSAPPEIIQKSVHCGVGLVFSALRDLARRKHLERLQQGRITHTDRLVFLHNIYCASQDIRKASPYAGFEPAPLLSFREIIVDEYQDTNPAQHDLLLTLASRLGSRMIVVGDPKQSLYGFRRAKVEVFRSLSEAPDWRRIILADNFRSEASLLGELNTLARLALTYVDPSIPSAFWESAHGQAAQRSQVEAMDLIPGREPDTHPSLTAVTILTHSLDSSRIPDSFKERLGSEGLNYTDLSAERLLHATETLLASGLSPADCAILCETNKDCETVADILRAGGINAKRPARVSKSKQPGHVLRSCLALIELITGSDGRLRSETSALTLFDLLTSPLMALPLRPAVLIAVALSPSTRETDFSPEARLDTFDETKHLLRLSEALQACKDDLPERCKSLLTSLFGDRHTSGLSATGLADVQRLATREPLGAWLVLAKALARETGYAFAGSPYEAWGLAFSESLESTGLWHALFPGGTRPFGRDPRARSSAWLPETLLHFDEGSCDQESTESSREGVDIMTVHGAKGLQWEAVVFLPHSRATPQTKTFRCLQLGDRNVVQWFESQGHLEIFGRVGPSIVDDPKALEDYLRNHRLRSPENPDDAEKSNELAYQEKAEQLFERARVFYTAITRAKKHLVLLPGLGTAGSTKSIRDNLAKLGPGASETQVHRELTGLIKHTLGLYLDALFPLRAYKGEGSRKKGLPREPWTESEEICHRGGQAEGEQARTPLVLYIDAAAPSLSERIQRAVELKRIREKAADGSTTPALTKVAGPFRSLFPAVGIPQDDAPAILPVHHQDEGRTWRDIFASVWRFTDTRSASPSENLQRGAPDDSHTKTRFESAGGRMEKVQEGLLIHAEQELSPAQNSSYFNDPIAELRQKAIHVHTEWELWTPTERPIEQTMSLAAPARNIVDLLCVVRLGELQGAFLSAPILHYRERGVFDEKSRDQIDENAPVWIVVDYKTGKASADHHVQMKRYLEAVGPLSLDGETGSGHLIGCLAYLDRSQTSPSPRWTLDFAKPL